MKPAFKRYVAELSLVLALYMAALIAPTFFDLDAWPRWGVVALALLPALAAVLLVPVILRFVGTMDEFQRRVVTESCLVSMIVVGLTSFAYAFARGAADLPEIGLMWVWPALIGTAGLAQLPVRLRLR